ncbi:Fic family protein [Lactococcus protaetiae]|uniref:Fic family protein n=1 Tax=Lactococcus protaetiae TaxID=2592653 RepID=UPI001CC1E571|nr:Fic family protein [Lactococcus protaetiae]
MKNLILEKLLEERKNGLKGGLYHKTQVSLTYNSNRIEGSKLTEEQTRYVFETKTVGFDADGLPVDDIIETSNHFRAFDYLLDTIEEDLSKKIIKTFHKILKEGTSDSHNAYFNVGDWKKIPNEVGDIKTSLPENVDSDISNLLVEYLTKPAVTFNDLIAFHEHFERIHSFQDGNGQVGRLILFRECLKQDIVPFVIDNDKKLFYYRGLREFATQSGYLIETCLAAQDCL